MGEQTRHEQENEIRVLGFTCGPKSKEKMVLNKLLRSVPDTVIIFLPAKLIIIYEGVYSYHLVYKQS